MADSSPSATAYVRGPRLARRWYRGRSGYWDPRLYESYFSRTPIGRALRRSDEQIVFDALATVLSIDDEVLEVGSGTGNYTLAVARRCARMVAIEPSPAMLEYLRQRVAREGVTNVETGPGRLPGPLGVDRRFDGVISLGVLNYVADLDGSLEALAGATRPGGWVLFSVPPRSLEGRLHALFELLARRRVSLRSATEASQSARRAGLRVERIATAGLTPGGITTLVLARAG